MILIIKARRNKAIQNIVDILERALKISLEIKADSAGRCFRHIKPEDLKLGNLYYHSIKILIPFQAVPGHQRASARVTSFI